MRLGVLGTMVWDTIHGRDPARGPVEEWGGIAYSLGALDATLGDDWEIVPLVKVGRDLAPRARALIGGLRHVAPGTRFIEVPHPNNRVTLHYQPVERRCERMSGGVPPWSWAELGPMVTDLDGLYVNFISGFELDLATAQLLRRGFPGFIYADLHSLFLGKLADGTRVLQPLADVAAWFACFDVVQLNDEELSQVGSDPLAVAALALGAGCRALCVTLAAQGAVVLTGSPVRSIRLPAGDAGLPPGDPGDPTGCGDVLGATAAARLLAGATLDQAFGEGVRLATRNLSGRGASGLRDHLLGRLATR
jgi:hypothetical protein